MVKVERGRRGQRTAILGGGGDCELRGEQLLVAQFSLGEEDVHDGGKGRSLIRTPGRRHRGNGGTTASVTQFKKTWSNLWYATGDKIQATQDVHYGYEKLGFKMGVHGEDLRPPPYFFFFTAFLLDAGPGP